MSGVVRRNTTFSRVSFFTFNPPPFDRIDAYNEMNPTLPLGFNESSLVQYQFTKDMRQPSGQVSISLKGYKVSGHPALVGKPWPDLIQEGDWWSVDVCKNGAWRSIAFGKIDEVQVHGSSGMRGEGQITVSITGRDIGFVLEDTPVYFNPYDSTQDNAVGIHMQQIIQTAAGSPSEVIVQIIRGFMGGLSEVVPLGGHVRIPPALASAAGAADPRGDPQGEVWIDFIDYTTFVQRNLRGKLATPTMFGVSGSNSLWAMLESWRNPPMNEFFVLGLPSAGYPKRAAIWLREKPFVNVIDGKNSPWYNLRSHRVDVSTLKAMVLGRGRNRVNHFQLLGDLVPALSEDSYSIFAPVADFEDIQIHGLRRLQENTRYYDDSKNSGVRLATYDWLALIVGWNVLNHRYWQGRIDVGEMRPEIQIGQKLFLINGPPANYPAFPNDRQLRSNVGDKAADQSSMSFYIDGIQHTYIDGNEPTAMTSIAVSQGYVEKDRLRDISARIARFEGYFPGTGSRNPDPLNLSDSDAVDDAQEGYEVDSTEGSV